MKVEVQIAITGTTAAVWETITDIKNAAKIISGIEKIELVSEPNAGLIGLKWSETRMYFGKPASIDKEITDASEHKFYQTTAAMDGFIFVTTMSIAEHGNEIILTSSHETKPTNFFAKLKSLPMPFFKGIMKNAIRQDLSDIKAKVENKSEAS